jgi:hypothetical protein
VREKSGPEVDRKRPGRAVERGESLSVEPQLDLRDGTAHIELDGLRSGSKAEEDREEGD